LTNDKGCAKVGAMKYDKLRKLDRNQMVKDAVKSHPELSLAEIGKSFMISSSRVSRITGGVRRNFKRGVGKNAKR